MVGSGWTSGSAAVPDRNITFPVLWIASSMILKSPGSTKKLICRPISVVRLEEYFHARRVVAPALSEYRPMRQRAQLPRCSRANPYQHLARAVWSPEPEGYRKQPRLDFALVAQPTRRPSNPAPAPHPPHPCPCP